MGSQLSPTLQAFLGGQQQFQNLAQVALGAINQQQQRQQQQQQLDDVMKRFDISSKQEQARIDDQHDLMGIHKRMAEYDMQDKIRTAIMGGSEGQSAPMVPNTPDPTYQNTTGVPGLDRPQMVQNRDYTYNSPVTGQPTTLHNMQFPADFQNGAQQSAVGMQKALLPGQLALAQGKSDITTNSKATLDDITDQYKKEYASNLADSAMALQQSKNETSEANRRTMITEALAKMGMRQADMVNRDYGTNDPGEIAKIVENNRASVANGLAPMSSIPVGQRTATSNALTRNGDTLATGGDNTKVRTAALSSAANVSRILSQADQLGAVLNTSNSNGSQASSKLAALFPWSDAAKAVEQYKATLAGHAAAEGFNASMMRSVMGMGSAAGAQIQPGDSANQQADKKLTLLDTSLNSIQGKMAGLGTAQKQALWKEIITSQPRLFNHQKFEPIIKELTGGSGNYDSTMVKDMYIGGGQR